MVAQANQSAMVSNERKIDNDFVHSLMFLCSIIVFRVLEKALLRLIVDSFPCYRDISNFEGRPGKRERKKRESVCVCVCVCVCLCVCLC